ncbi:hypothetical protein [Miniphocaeibacter massiliensis]|uniref:hypothetical protein n=1 Tax=Miniphocaeibacter massiliensis TaxID=2041841 RepID=UPI000C1B8449|nr:hypothetical protein [Miniphocaeibacter massiliensis]
MKKRLLVFLLLLLVFFTGCASKKEEDKKIDINGTWEREKTYIYWNLEDKDSLVTIEDGKVLEAGNVDDDTVKIHYKLSLALYGKKISVKNNNIQKISGPTVAFNDLESYLDEYNLKYDKFITEEEIKNYIKHFGYEVENLDNCYYIINTLGMAKGMEEYFTDADGKPSKDFRHNIQGIYLFVDEKTMLVMGAGDLKGDIGLSLNVFKRTEEK